MSKIHLKNKKTMNKRILGLVIISIFIAMTLSGCIGQEKKDILRIGHDHEPGLMDPARFTWSSDHAIISNIYSYLIGFEPGTFNMVGDLAKEVPSVENGLISPDGLTITFEIKIGIKWHPGIPNTPYAGKDYGEVTAHDIVYTIERLKGMHDLAPYEVIYGAAFKNIEKVEAIDDYMVIFSLHQVDVELLWNLAPYRNSAIVNKQAIEDYDEEYWKYPIGSGPFKFDRWTSSNEFIIVKHNGYYGTKPWLDQIIYIPYADEIVRFNALTSDEIDICSLETLELWSMANQNRDIEIATRLGLKTVGLSFNFEWLAPDGRKPLADVRVRRAIAHATNKMEIIDQLLGGIHSEAVGLLNSNYVGSIKEKDLPPEYLYPYNITKAKILLAEAGYPYGINLIFHGVTLPYYDAIPLLLKTQWERANIRLQIVLEEISKWTKRMFMEADYCMGWLILSPRPPEPLGVFKTMFHSVSEVFGLNYAKYSNPETDTLIDQAAITLDLNARYDFYKQIQINIMRDLPTYPLLWETTFFVHQKTVKNIYVDLFHTYGDWMEEAIIDK